MIIYYSVNSIKICIRQRQRRFINDEEKSMISLGSDKPFSKKAAK